MRPPLFVLVGDSFLCEEKRKEILATLDKKWGPNLPVTVRRAGESTLPSLLSEARTLPFLARAQVFCLRDVDRFPKSEIELWETYFQSPAPQSFFIFEAESLEKGHPFLEWAGKTGSVFWLEGQGEKIVTGFIHRKLNQAQKKMSREALELLTTRLGGSFIFLDSFLNQLILHSGEKPEIERSDVEAFEERWVQFEGGDLVQALADKNLTQALEVLGELLEENARDFPSFVGLLHWQLRNFWEAKTALSEGATEREVASRLRLWPARAALFFKQLHHFSIEELERILEGLFDLDWRLKTGRAEGRYEIENWLVRTISVS